MVYGEFCGASIQKGVRYTQGEAMIFRTVDIRLGDNLVTHDLFVEICGATELPSVPEVGRGETNLEAFFAKQPRGSRLLQTYWSDHENATEFDRRFQDT